MSAQPAPQTAAEPSSSAWSGRLTAAARLRERLAGRPTPLVMRRIALAGVIASAAIIPTGAAVRLSQSGLGCTNWPRCTAGSLVAGGATGDPLVHRWIEFGNRMITAVIFVIALAVLVAALRFRDQEGRRRSDLIALASAQPAGIAAQAVIGGIVVLTKLAPFWVSLHYLATLPVLAAAVALHVRCTEGRAKPTWLVHPIVRLVVQVLVAVSAVMMVAGTLVTGTGPLAGARTVPRYHFMSLTAVTQLHADIGWVLGTTAVMAVGAAYLTGAPARVRRLAWTVVGLIGAQGVIGYVQYFAHLPAGLVWVHVANTAVISIAVLRLYFALRDRGAIAALPSTGPVR